jgi:NAD-dependent dihydropyrimidine dehydrogenase PreA subunit
MMMTKTWYPVVDYLICTECGFCVKECPHNVYDKTKAPTPVVRKPEACIDQCRGCGNRCPAGAITYVGDDTGRIPPKERREAEASCYACGCEEYSGNKVHVEYLYLDLQTCDRCLGTDKVLDEAMAVLTPALRLAGYAVEYHKVKVETAEVAERQQFWSSPTIRVNGRDVCLSVKENSCGCCSDISGTNVACRVFEYNGEEYEVPPIEMLAKSILQNVFGHIETGCDCGKYELPENLKNFFAGKENKSACSCEDKCC